MKRKIVAGCLAFFALACFSSAIFEFNPFRYIAKGKNGSVPIQNITGIYTEAELKPDCKIEYGVYLPPNDNGIWIRAAFIDGAVQAIDEAAGGPVDNSSIFSDIRIIDVYGDKCTIMYTRTNPDASQGTELYRTEDYPLSNLRYNALTVAAANDSRKQYLRGSGFDVRVSESLLVKRSHRITEMIVGGVLLTGSVPVLTVGKKKSGKDNSKTEEAGS